MFNKREKLAFDRIILNRVALFENDDYQHTIDTIDAQQSRIKIRCRLLPALALNASLNGTLDELRDYANSNRHLILAFEANQLSRLTIDSHGIVRLLSDLVFDDACVYVVQDTPRVEMVIQLICEAEVKVVFHAVNRSPDACLDQNASASRDERS